MSDRGCTAGSSRSSIPLSVTNYGGTGQLKAKAGKTAVMAAVLIAAPFGMQPAYADSVAVNLSVDLSIFNATNAQLVGTFPKVVFYTDCAHVGSVGDVNASAAWVPLTQSGTTWGVHQTQMLPRGTLRVALEVERSRVWNGRSIGCEDSAPVTVDGSPIQLQMDNLRRITYRAYDQNGTRIVPWQIGFDPASINARYAARVDEAVHFYSSCQSQDPSAHIAAKPQAAYNDDAEGIQPYSDAWVFLPASRPVYAAIAWRDVVEPPSGVYNVWHKSASGCSTAAGVLALPDVTTDLYFALPGTQPAVTKAAQSLRRQSMEKVRRQLSQGKPASLPRRTSQGLVLKWKSTSKKVCRVRGGRVLPLVQNRCYLAATAKASSSYLPFRYTMSVKIHLKK